MASLGYATVGSNSLEKAKVFYDALFAPAGITGVFEHPTGGRIYGKAGSITFGVLGPYDGKPASVGNGGMIALQCESASLPGKTSTGISITGHRSFLNRWAMR